jgi:hypothetical protein
VSAAGDEVEKAFDHLLQQLDARERFVVLHALGQLAMLKEDEAFGSISLHVVAGRIRQSKLEQTIQG